MSERTRALQHVFGETKTAAENVHEFLLKARDTHDIEMKHGSVFLSAQATVYDTARVARELRVSKPERTVSDVIEELQRALVAVDAVKHEIDRRDGDVDWIEHNVEEHLESALTRAKEVENDMPPRDKDDIHD